MVTVQIPPPIDLKYDHGSVGLILNYLKKWGKMPLTHNGYEK